jgi:hypothetical protein
LRSSSHDARRISANSQPWQISITRKNAEIRRSSLQFASDADSTRQKKPEAFALQIFETPLSAAQRLRYRVCQPRYQPLLSNIADVVADNEALRARLQSMEQRFAKLTATVDELMSMLVERGALDDAATRARIAKAMKPRQVASTGAAPQAMVRCADCGSSLPIARSNMIEHGTVCDACV